MIKENPKNESYTSIEQLQEEQVALVEDLVRKAGLLRAAKMALSNSAAGPWQTGDPPKDGTLILADFGDDYHVVRWEDSCEEWIFGWTIRDQWGHTLFQFLPEDEPIRWARINTSKEEK